VAKELPYLPSYKHVEKLFKAIDAAKKPEALTTRVLSETFGITGSGDRPLITLLKTLGFLDQSGKPTPSYDLLKNPTEAPYAIAAGVRKAYAPLFDANENAHSLAPEALRGLIAQVAGADRGVASKIAGTFNSLVKLGNFGRPRDAGEETPSGDELADQDSSEEQETDEGEDGKPRKEQYRRPSGLRPEFHYNIQVHLPANGSEETYLRIFNAIRKTFR
jgi:hypothetical protein